MILTYDFDILGIDVLFTINIPSVVIDAPKTLPWRGAFTMIYVEIEN